MPLNKAKDYLMRTLLKIGGTGIMILAASAGLQAQPTVIGSVPDPLKAGVSQQCGREQQTGVSGCTHDRSASKQRNTAFFTAIWGEDGNAEEHTALESGRARYHDGDRTRMWVVEPANNADLAAIAAADDEFCGALAKTSAAGTKHNRDSSKAGHVVNLSVYLALSSHGKRRSQRRNTKCPKW